MASKKQRRYLAGMAPYENGAAAGTSLGFNAAPTGAKAPASVSAAPTGGGSTSAAGGGQPFPGWDLVGVNKANGKGVFEFSGGTNAASSGGGASAAPTAAKTGGGY